MIEYYGLMISNNAFFVVIWRFFDSQKVPLRSCHVHGSQKPNIFLLVLPNEVLDILAGQRATELEASKLHSIQELN